MLGRKGRKEQRCLRVVSARCVGCALTKDLEAELDANPETLQTFSRGDGVARPRASEAPGKLERADARGAGSVRCPRRGLGAG